MVNRLSLLEQFLHEAPYQPATDWWRAIEIDHVIKRGLPTGRGLDLGCGDGKLTSIVTAAVGQREFIGIDLDPQEADCARQTGLYAIVHTASATAIPEPDESFDFVFSNSVLEHIPDIEAVLDEVERVLRAGGQFVFTVPGPEFHACLSRANTGRPAEYFRKIDQRCAHLRYWSEAEWRTQLSKRGMSIQRSESYMSASEIRRWEMLSNWTAGLLTALFRGRKRPIEIQRSLGMRKASIRMPRPIAKMVAPAIMFGIDSDKVSPDGPAGCLYIACEKKKKAAGDVVSAS